MPRLAPLLGGLLLSRGARRYAGKLALAAIAWKVVADRRRRRR
ncbi:MAG: hypothetical protein V7678_03040 [Brevundimonas sp.]